MMSKKDETQSSAARKTSAKPQEHPIKCPRCDSPNTKFCYYNNYSLTQPRHFCKTCRRYWTKGGALRNIPIGGGCRKNKKMKSPPTLSGDSKDSLGCLKFFQGISPAMDFQPPPNTGFLNQFSSLPPVLPNPNYFNIDNSGFQEMGLHTNLESLSYINQDLHWKLQQQRLAAMFNQKENQAIESPIMFQNLEGSRKEGENGNLSWFSNNSYATIPTSTPTPATSSSNNNNSNWSGIQAWTELTQLP